VSGFSSGEHTGALSDRREGVPGEKEIAKSPMDVQVSLICCTGKRELRRDTWPAGENPEVPRRSR